MGRSTQERTEPKNNTSTKEFIKQNRKTVLLAEMKNLNHSSPMKGI